MGNRCGLRIGEIMTKIMIGIYNQETGENEIREATVEEIELQNATRDEINNLLKTQETKTQNRDSALAKFAALGLTPDEVASL